MIHLATANRWDFRDTWRRTYCGPPQKFEHLATLLVLFDRHSSGQPNANTNFVFAVTGLLRLGVGELRPLVAAVQPTDRRSALQRESLRLLVQSCC